MLPLNGTAKPFGALIMGHDLVAVDATCCRLMMLDPDKIGYLVLGAMKKLGRMKPSGQKAFAARDEKRSGVYSFENAPRKLDAAYEKIVRPLLFAFDPERAHHLAIGALRAASQSPARTEKQRPLLSLPLWSMPAASIRPSSMAASSMLTAPMLD